MLLSEALTAMLANRMRKRAEATKAYRESHVKPLLAFFGDVDVRSLTYERLNGYVNFSGVSGHTTVKRMTTLKMALFEAQCLGHLDRLPPWPQVDNDYTPRDTFLTREEAEAVSAELPPHRRLWLWVGLGTAMHASDISSMTWSQTRLGASGRLEFLRRNTKNGAEPLWAPLPSWSDSALRSARGVGLVCGPWDRASRDLTAAAKRAGIDKALCPNDLRRTCATWMAEAGVPIEVTRKFLGHGPNSKMLEGVYLVVSEERLREAAV